MVLLGIGLATVYLGGIVALSLGSFLWSIRPGKSRITTTGEGIETVDVADEVAVDVVTESPGLFSATGENLADPALDVPEQPTTTVVDTDPNVFFVSPQIGNNDFDGQTADSPWQSLQTALLRIQAGQTLYLMDGVYNEVTAPDYAHYQIDVSGTPDAWVTVAAAPGHTPEVVPNSGNAIEIKGSYVRFDGIHIRGETYSEENSYGWGVIIRDTHHVRVENTQISDMPVGGISSVESSNLEIYDNVVFGNSFWGTEQGSGISIWHSKDHGQPAFDDGYHDKIIGNTSYKNENKVYSRFANSKIITDGNGIIIDESLETGYTGKTLVANNTVFDNGGRGVIVNRARDVDIVFNTAYNNARTQELAGGKVEIAAVRSIDVRVMNNLGWSRPGSPALGIIEMNGIVVGGNVWVTDSPSGLETDQDRVVASDPGLAAPSLDPALADFRPLLGSVVVDSALDGGVRMPVDADGKPRPQGAADVGAFEFAP